MNERFKSPPLKAFEHGPVPGSDLAVTQWRATELHGWIAAIAVTGPDRASENTYAESLGYKVGRFPLVPLAGPVVAHNPRILEVYQTNTEYRSAAGAADYMRQTASSVPGAATVRQKDNGTVIPNPFPIRIGGGGSGSGGGGEIVALETPQYVMPHVGPTERFFSFTAQFGRYILEMSVQGGNAVTAAAAVAVLNAAARNLTRSCSLAPVTFHVAS